MTGYPDDGVESGLAIREGDVIAGKYRVERVLGRGGMGVVVAAEHLRLRQRVAIKLLLPSISQDPQAVARFLREARTGAQIQSEHVTRVLDSDTLETGVPYIVMELLQGSDLSQVIEHRSPLPMDEAIDYLLQACEAIAEAHALGMVHRDLKPANLFLTRSPDGKPLVKVLDFGISKVTEPDSEAPSFAMTAATAMMGSPTYMSPEQIRSSKDVDARTDVWALGVILYEFLASKPPFFATSLPAQLAMIAADPTPSLSALRPDLPAGLGAIVTLCLEKDRTRRIQNVAQLASALAPFAATSSRVSIERILRTLNGGPASDAGPATGAMSPYGSPPVTPGRIISSTNTSAGGAAWTARPSTPRFKGLAIGLVLIAMLGIAALIVVYRPFGHSGAVSSIGSDPGPAAPAEAVPAKETAASRNPLPLPREDAGAALAQALPQDAPPVNTIAGGPSANPSPGVTVVQHPLVTPGSASPAFSARKPPPAAPRRPHPSANKSAEVGRPVPTESTPAPSPPPPADPLMDRR